jgi:FecR protein
MHTRFLLAAIFVCAGVSAFAATPLTESTFTEIIHEANVVTAADKSVAPAKPNEVFKVPDLVRTGSASRVEMTAPDQTITRVGANTIFTFAPGGRDIILERGSVLFHAPAGVGGGAIKNHGTAAAVLGTTEIGAILSDGSFKILDLEGAVKVTLKNGLYMELKAGEMVIVSPDGNEFSPLMIFNLGQLLPHLLLVTGFSEPLSSLPLIDVAIQEQNQAIADGKLDNLVSLQTAGLGLDFIFRVGNGFPINVLDNGPDLTREWMSPVQP